MVASSQACARRVPIAATEAGRHGPLDARAAKSRVALVRPSTFSTLDEALRAALAELGALAIRAGEGVLLKPALNSARSYPATADPATVAAMAKVVLELGAKPLVADRTMFAHSTDEALAKTGMREALERLGVPVLALDRSEASWVRHPKAEHWSDCAVELYRPALEADHIINLCTPRTHGIAGFTLALKNNVGLVNGARRLWMHRPGGFHQRLAEISLFTRPTLVVLDGRRGFTSGGPDTGTEVALDFLAVSDDPAAVDAVGMAMLKLAGARLSTSSVWTEPVLRRAVEIGIGAKSRDELELVGPGVAHPDALWAALV